MKTLFVLTALLAVGSALSHISEERQVSENRAAGRELTAFSTPSLDIDGLLVAVASNDIAQVLNLLSCRCINVNTPILLFNGRTILFVALDTDNLAIVRALLQAGADPNFRDSFGITPVHVAAFQSTPAILRVLIEAGGNPKVKTTVSSETPLHFPGNRDIAENAKILLDAGADIEAKDIQGETPLLEAVAYGAERVARLLLERGANINAKTANGTKPIDFICACRTFIAPEFTPCGVGQCTPQDIKTVQGVVKEFLEKNETAPKSSSKKKSKKKSDKKEDKKEDKKKGKKKSSSKEPPASPLEKLKQKLDKLDKDRVQDGR